MNQWDAKKQVTVEQALPDGIFTAFVMCCQRRNLRRLVRTCQMIADINSATLFAV